MRVETSHSDVSVSVIGPIDLKDAKPKDSIPPLFLIGLISTDSLVILFDTFMALLPVLALLDDEKDNETGAIIFLAAVLAHLLIVGVISVLCGLIALISKPKKRGTKCLARVRVATTVGHVLLGIFILGIMFVSFITS